MGKIFQVRAKVKVNNVIGQGFTFNVPSKWSGKPTGSEIQEALEKQFGKDAGRFATDASKFEIIA